MNKKCDEFPNKQRSVLNAEKLASDLMNKEATIAFNPVTRISFGVTCIACFISLMFASKSDIGAVIFGITILFMVILWIIGKIEIYNKRKEYSKKILSGNYRIISCRTQKKDRNISSDPIDYYIEFKCDSWDSIAMSWSIDKKRYNAIEGNEEIYLVVLNHFKDQEIVIVYWAYEWILHPELEKKLEYIS